MKSKRYKKLPEKTFDLKSETIDKLLPEIKNNCTAKFNESIDISLFINVKQKKGDVNLRTVINLPEGTGKKIKVGVVCEESKHKDAKINPSSPLLHGRSGLVSFLRKRSGNRVAQRSPDVRVISKNYIKLIIIVFCNKRS